MYIFGEDSIITAG